MRYAAPSLPVRNRIPVVNKSSLNERVNFTVTSGGHCSLPVAKSQIRLSLSSEGMFQRELTIERQTCFLKAVLTNGSSNEKCVDANGFDSDACVCVLFSQLF